MYTVYILQCADNSLYTGLTTDIKRRLAEHQAGGAKAARYTRSRRPVKLVWESDPLPNKSQAAALEWKIKHLNRIQKLQLVEESTVRSKIT